MVTGSAIAEEDVPKPITKAGVNARKTVNGLRRVVATYMSGSVMSACTVKPAKTTHT
jgi:hypothetical protein